MEEKLDLILKRLGAIEDWLDALPERDDFDHFITDEDLREVRRSVDALATTIEDAERRRDLEEIRRDVRRAS